MYKLRTIDFNRYIGAFAKVVCVIQLVFAFVWLVMNGGIVQSDFLANNYIEAGNTLVVDNHMGILYALIVRVIGGGVLLHFAQLAIVAITAYFALGFLGALLVAGNLYVLQCCFTTRPEALFLSCLFLLICMVRKKSGFRLLSGIACAGIVAVLLTPNYIFVYLPICIILGLFYAIKRKKDAASLFGATLPVLVAFILVNSLVCVPHAYGRSVGSFSYYRMQRVVWPYVLEFNNVLKEYYGTDMKTEMHAAEKNAEMLDFFAGKLEMQLGTEAAYEFYDRISEVYYKHGIGYLTKPIVKDMGQAFFAPFAVPIKFCGNSSDPTFARVTYMLVGKSNLFFKMYIYFFAISTLILAGMAVLRAVVKKDSAICLFFLAAVCCSLYSTFLCTRDFDYRNVVFCLCGWQVLFLLKKKEEV